MLLKKIVLMLLASIVMFGCGSSKKTKVQYAEIQGERLELLDLYAQLADTYKDWSDVYLPVNLSLQAPVSTSISGRATMIRDKEVYLSLRVFGLEAAVLYANADSLYVVDKYHKLYLEESLRDLLGGVSLSIGDFQDLLLGRAFAAGQGTVGKDVEVELFFDDDLKDAWGIEPIKTADYVDWWCTVSETVPPKLSTLSFAQGNDGQLDCIYSDNIETPAGIVAEKVAINGISKDKGFNAQVKWDLDEAKWNSGRSVNFKKPKGFKRINSADLKKILGN